MDQETIAVYDAKYQDYAALTKSDAPSKSLQNFIQAVKPGGQVLDLGCGPGAAAGHIAAAGLNVLALDASEGMVKLAAEQKGVEAFQADFAWLKGQDARFDGIWANFALLHVTAEDFPGHLDDVARALKPSGILHLGMKTGSGTKRDTLGRRYCYFPCSEFEALLKARGFELISVFESEDRSLAGAIDPIVMILARNKA